MITNLNVFRTGKNHIFAGLAAFFIFTAVLLAAIGDGQLGKFDASNQDDPALPNRIWRAYSVVDQSPSWPANLLVSTRTAYSDDNGTSFIDLGLINPAADLPYPNLSWSHEVPTIVFDPSDPDNNADWKLIWHRILLNNGIRDFEHSWLGIKGTALPIGPWSSELKLMAGTLYNPNDMFNPEPRFPLFYPLPTELSDCLVITEPGTLAALDGFYMAFHCATGNQMVNTRMPLVKFRHPLGGGTVLEVKGTLLSPADASLFAQEYGDTYPELQGTVAFSAPSMFEKNGAKYLIATPVSTTVYMGCAVFKITNLETASIQRNNGIPRMLKYIQGTVGTTRGACTYTEASTGSGVVLSQFVAGAPQPFTLINTGIQIP